MILDLANGSRVRTSYEFLVAEHVTFHVAVLPANRAIHHRTITHERFYVSRRSWSNCTVYYCHSGLVSLDILLGYADEVWDLKRIADVQHIARLLDLNWFNVDCNAGIASGQYPKERFAYLSHTQNYHDTRVRHGFAPSYDDFGF